MCFHSRHHGPRCLVRNIPRARGGEDASIYYSIGDFRKSGPWTLSLVRTIWAAGKPWIRGDPGTRMPATSLHAFPEAAVEAQKMIVLERTPACSEL
jgi:hypothetical protein